MASADLGELGQAYIALKIKREQLQQELRDAKQQVQRHGDDAANEGGGGGLMDRYLYGRRGREGVGEGLEHVLTHSVLGKFSRLFMAGGGVGLAVGLVAHSLVDLAKEWLSTAEATEKAAKASEAWVESSKKAAEAAAKLQEIMNPKVSGKEQIEELLHPKSFEQKLIEVFHSQDEKIKALRESSKADMERSGNASITAEEREKIRAGVLARKGAPGWTYSFLPQSWREQMGFGGKIDARSPSSEQVERSILGRRMQLNRDAAETKESDAKRLEGYRDLGIDIVHGGVGFARRAGPAIEAGIGSFFNAESNLLAPGQRGLDIKRETGQGILDMRRDFGRRKAAYEEERPYRSMGGATDVSQIGQQIQAALLQPDPWKREERELNRKIKDAVENMEIKIANLDPRNWLKSSMAAVAATFTKGP